jgi:hypothetical protein
VPRPPRLLVAGVAVVAITGPVAGCGGGSDDSNDAKRPAPGAEVKPPRLPSLDRRAFGRIQSASGALRAAAIPVAYGASEVVDGAAIGRAKRRVRDTQPRNPQLRELRASTLDALDAFSSATQGAAAKAVANEAIAEADRIDAGLRRYAASHPAANEIGPR